MHEYNLLHGKYVVKNGNTLKNVEILAMQIVYQKSIAVYDYYYLRLYS